MSDVHSWDISLCTRHLRPTGRNPSMGCVFLAAIYSPMKVQEPDDGDEMAKDIQAYGVTQHEKVTKGINGPALIEDRHLEARPVLPILHNVKII